MLNIIKIRSFYIYAPGKGSLVIYLIFSGLHKSSVFFQGILFFKYFYNENWTWSALLAGKAW